MQTRTQEFLSGPEPSSPALRALWWAGRGEWARAHEFAQAGEGGPADWVHAYLHRVEGDDANAGYWYRQAGQTPASGPFEPEWEAIAQALL